MSLLISHPESQGNRVMFWPSLMTGSIFSLMDPMPDAVESFEELSKIYDTYILSTAPWENPSAWSDKLLWVKKHLGRQAYKRLILSHHKNLNDGHYLIDDRTKNGADRFRGGTSISERRSSQIGSRWLLILSVEQPNNSLQADVPDGPRPDLKR